MADIVERLRDPKLTVHGRAGLVEEAAEALEAYHEQYAAVTDLAENLSDDNTRLRALNAELVEALEEAASRYDRIVETALKWQRVCVQNEMAVERWRAVQLTAEKGKQDADAALSRARTETPEPEGDA